MPRVSRDRPSWTFLTNHAHVLICLQRQCDLRIRDLSQQIGITERAVQAILAELVRAGYLRIEKEGRRNRYRLDGQLRLRHPLEEQHRIGELLDALV